MAASRLKRHNAGKNIGKLLDQELDADDFYKTAYGGFEDTLEDGVYQSEDSDDDEVDSDFDAPEQEASENEKDEDLEPKRKKKVITVFKSKPLSSKPKPKAKKGRNRTVSEVTIDGDSRTLRKSTQERSQEFKERYEEITRRKHFSKKRIRTVHKRLTQEELLAEAKRTERENLASLEAYTRLEAEKKKVKEKNHEIKGPFIRFHSVVMPLIEDIGKEKKTNESTSKSEEKYSRNFLVFTDTKSFPHQYFPQGKPKVAKPQFCPITGLPARYVDPITKTPYATASAFKVIRNQYVSQEEIKCEKRLLQLSNWLEEKKRKKMEVT